MAKKEDDKQAQEKAPNIDAPTFDAPPPDAPNLDAKKLAAELKKAGVKNVEMPDAQAADPATAQEEPKLEWSVSPSAVDYEDPLLNCLTILSNLYQTPISRQALKTGLPNADIDFSPEICVRAAMRAGFNAKIVARKKIKDISPLVLPCIILLKDKNACILSRFDKKKKAVEVLTSENEGAPVKISIEKLEEEYVGYAIFSKPTVKLDKRAHFVELKERKDWFWGTLLKFWRIYIHVMIASFVVNFFALAGPLFVMNVYDRVVPNNAIETLWVLAVGVGSVYLFEFVLKNLRSYFVDIAGRNADVIMGSRLLEHVMGMRLDELPPSIGSTANNMKDFEQLRDFFSSGTVTILVDIPFMFLFLGVIWLIAGPVAIIPLAMVPVVLVAAFIIQIPLVRVIEKTAAESNQKYALLFETLSGLETIKTNTAESKIQGMWERIVNVSADSSAQSRGWSALATSFTSFSIQFTTVMIIIYGVYEIAEGNMTMGALVAASMLTGRAMAPLGTIASLLVRYQQTKLGLTSLNELMKKPLERPEGKKFISFDSMQGLIKFDKVNFAYPGSDDAALEEVSFKIRPGERVGILGRIGSGKSTLGRLMTGLYSPTGGSISIDGTELQQIDPSDVRQNIGYITQDNFLFYGTIRENIAFGAPHLTESEIKRAAKISGVMDFARQSSLGLDYQVGERGMSLSGGQRQAVAIARALTYDPPIMLMDEPTSNMDLSSEARFISRMDQFLPGRTLILITHRHSVLNLVDRLILMDRGKVLADGPKDEIIEKIRSGEIKAAAD